MANLMKPWGKLASAVFLMKLLRLLLGPTLWFGMSWNICNILTCERWLKGPSSCVLFECCTPTEKSIQNCNYCSSNLNWHFLWCVGGEAKDEHPKVNAHE